MNVQGAIYSKLKADATLVALLGTYKTNTAIFLAAPAPPDAPLPLIIMEGAVSDTHLDSSTETIRNILVDVRVYTKASGLPTAIEAITERVRELLHRQTLTLSGYTNHDTICENIAMSPSEADVYGRILTFRIYLQKD